MTLLKKQRLAKGLSQTKLARKMKCMPSTISHWEAGLVIPRAESIPELAKFLGISPEALVEMLQNVQTAPGSNGANGRTS